MMIIIIQLINPGQKFSPFSDKKFDRSKHWTGIFLRLFYHEGGYIRGKGNDTERGRFHNGRV